MLEPYPLPDNWFLEGCMDLGRKQGLLQNITKLGWSAAFAACVDDFIAGKNIESHIPSDEVLSEWTRLGQMEE